MARYFATIAYDGSNYHGWQVQPNALTVQEEINKALTMILREEVNVVGCGRTDTGVHASSFVLHFDTTVLVDEQHLVYKLNSLLPPSISFYSICAVSEDSHARFDAVFRRYHYHVVLRKEPFMNATAHRLRKKPDFEKMNRVAHHLLGKQDFTSFSKLHTDVKTNICNVTHAKWVQVNDYHWYFDIQADRFLRNMVRSIVGTLLEVGYDKQTEDAFLAVISAKNRCEAGMSVDARGLFLVEVGYGFNFC